MAQWLGQFTGRTHATRVEDDLPLRLEVPEQLGAADTGAMAEPPRGVHSRGG